ncbi:MAG: sugar transferase [Burkholderiales bacterium]|nr:sugar transferase [Opitutaceae bacterium]
MPDYGQGRSRLCFRGPDNQLLVMLNHRKNGLVALHSFLICVLLTTAFGCSLAAVTISGVIPLNAHVSWFPYFAGILLSSFWIHHGLRGVGDRLGALDMKEAAWLTAQQATRLAVVLSTLAFATKDVGVSRAFLIGFAGLAAGVLFFANFVLARMLADVFFRGRRLRTVIVAPGTEARLLQDWLSSRGHLGIDVVGYATLGDDNGRDDHDDKGGRLCGLKDLPRIISRHRVDQLVFCQSDCGRKEIAEVVRAAELANCRVRFFVDMHALFGGKGEALEYSERYAFATSTQEPLDDPCNRLLKRALDLAVALPIVALVLPPLTIFVWIMQRGQSAGPVFYSQIRSGLNREQFSILKYRTMHVGDVAATGIQAQSDDPRVFPFGRFLRKTSLDEMPQFINVLLGSMSVSGPRPHLLEHDERFSQVEESYFKRHYVKPGITGLAQSKGYRGELRVADDLGQRVRYDALYVAHWSLALDLGILVRTVAQVVAPPKSAY